jgi:hypothetical protein
MKTTNFSPDESFEIIESVIKQAKTRFEENGFAFILWGIIVPICCFSQAYLIAIGKGAISWYPYLIMPLVSMISIIYYVKKKNFKQNPLKLVSLRLWLFTGVNIMIIAFGFNSYLESNLTSIILLLMGIATVVAGSFIRSSLLLYCGIMLNLSAYIAFFIPWKNQALFMGIIAILTFLIPGILLRIKHKKNNV